MIHKEKFQKKKKKKQTPKKKKKLMVDGIKYLQK